MWALWAKMPAKMPAKNCRTKIAGQKCRQKHADMSPPQSPAHVSRLAVCSELAGQ
jgi:hypothetical protein